MNVLGRGLSIALAMVLIALGVLGSVATVMGFFGTAWWVFDLVANFRVALLIGLLVVAIVYGMSYGRVAALVFLAAAAVNLVAILPFYLGNQPAPTEAIEDDLRITIHNVTASNQRRAAVLDHLAATESDVVFVFESSVDWERAARTADLPYRIAAVPPPGRTFGTMVLAAPSLDLAVEDLFIATDLDTITKVTIGDTVIFALHPRSPTSARGSEERDRLLAAATELAAAEPGPTIVAGDLNATPWSHALRSMQDDAELRNSLRGYGLQPTWPADWRLFSIPIDHVLMSSDLTTVSRATGPPNGSDHLPVTVVVSPAS